MTTPPHDVTDHHDVSGRAVALQRRQMLTERLLVDVLGLEWAIVHTEAEKVVAAVSPRVEEHLVALLGDPGTCPHGNPIPGSSSPPDQTGAVPLADTPVSSIVEVVRVEDAIEEDVPAMRLLQAVGLLPERWAEVVGRSGPGVTVVGSRADGLIPWDAAWHVFVRSVDPTEA